MRSGDGSRPCRAAGQILAELVGLVGHHENIVIGHLREGRDLALQGHMAGVGAGVAGLERPFLFDHDLGPKALRRPP